MEFKQRIVTKPVNVAEYRHAQLFASTIINKHLSRNMTKPTEWVCAQRRLGSAWASAKSDQSLRCPHEESLGP